jgi:AraC-like DNA-binding protein
MALFRSWRPRPPLSEFVEMLWSVENSSAENSGVLQSRESVLPYGSFDLIIHLDGPARGALLSGAYSESRIIDSSPGRNSLLGVHFKPGGAASLFGIPAAEFQNLHVPLDTLWTRSSGELVGHLTEAASVSRKFQILEQFLCARLLPAYTTSPVVAFALKHFQTAPQTYSVADVVNRTGFSQTRFTEMFRRTIGLTPKLFCRIQRFQAVLRGVAHGHPIDWADVAAAHGFFDQAHFIHDFQALSGLTPESYIARKGEAANHIPLNN